MNDLVLVKIRRSQPTLITEGIPSLSVFKEIEEKLGGHDSTAFGVLSVRAMVQGDGPAHERAWVKRLTPELRKRFESATELAEGYANDPWDDSTRISRGETLVSVDDELSVGYEYNGPEETPAPFVELRKGNYVVRVALAGETDFRRARDALRGRIT